MASRKKHSRKAAATITRKEVLSHLVNEFACFREKHGTIVIDRRICCPSIFLVVVNVLAFPYTYLMEAIREIPVLVQHASNLEFSRTEFPTPGGDFPVMQLVTQIYRLTAKIELL